MRLVVLVLVLLALFAVGTAALVFGVGGRGEEASPPRVVTVTTGADAAEPPPDDTVGLPDPVAETRAAILAAAEAGDYDALAALAGDEFHYSFGGPLEGGPAAYWRAAEENGERPLEALAAILRLPYALASGLYVWPFAHGSDPSQFTEYERGLLAEIPGGAPVRPEGYLGWRAGISPDGEWRFYVAGD